MPTPDERDTLEAGLEACQKAHDHNWDCGSQHVGPSKSEQAPPQSGKIGPCRTAPTGW
jgi:hypothetical protein